MSESIKQMRERHKKEIEKLQSKCKHKDISDWMPYMWAPGHVGSPVRVCEYCEKVIERK